MPIEQKAPEVERLVALNEEIEWLGEGFGGVDDQNDQSESRITGVKINTLHEAKGGTL